MPRPAAAAWVVLLLLVGTAAFSGLALLLAGTLRAEATLAAANLVYLVLLGVGGVIFPLTKFPAGAQPVLRLLPSGALSDGLRSVLAAGGGLPVRDLVVLLVWAVVGDRRHGADVPLGVGRFAPPAPRPAAPPGARSRAAVGARADRRGLGPGRVPAWPPGSSARLPPAAVTGLRLWTVGAAARGRRRARACRRDTRHAGPRGPGGTRPWSWPSGSRSAS